MNKKMSLVITVVFFAFHASGDSAAATAFQDLFSIIKSADSFDKKNVSVFGYLENQFENQTLRPAICGAEMLSSENGKIWLNLTKVRKEMIKYVDSDLVIVSGRILAKEKGHMGLSAGTLEVTKISKAKKSDLMIMCKQIVK